MYFIQKNNSTFSGKHKGFGIENTSMLKIISRLLDFVYHKFVFLQQHAYPASHQNSALRVSFLFLAL